MPEEAEGMDIKPIKAERAARKARRTKRDYANNSIGIYRYELRLYTITNYS